MTDVPGSWRRGSVLNLAGAAATGVSTLVLVLVTARALPPDQAGTVFAVTSGFLVLATLLRGGTPTGVVLFVSREVDPPPGHVRRVAALALRPVLVASAAVALLLAPFASALAPRLGMGDGPGPTVAVLVLLACLPAAALVEPVLAVSRGQHRMLPTVLVERLGRPLLQVLLTVVALASPSVLTVTCAWCVPYLLALVAAWAATPGLDGEPASASTPAQRREFRAFVAPRAVTAVVQVGFSRLDVVLVAWLAGPTEAAVYTVATRFVPLCQLVQQAVATAAEPAVAAHLGRGQTAHVTSLYRTATTLLVLLLWPALIAGAVLSPIWLRLFGSEYADATAVVAVLVAAMLVATGAGMVETVLAMAGRPTLLLGTNITAFAVMIGLDLLLVPEHGALGAAAGWAAAIVTKNLLPLFWLRRLVDDPFGPGWQLAVGLNVLLLVVPAALAAPRLSVAGEALVCLAGLVALACSYAVLRSPLGLRRRAVRVQAPEKTPAGASC